MHCGHKLIGQTRKALRRALQQLRPKRIGREQSRFARFRDARRRLQPLRCGGAECADQFSTPRIILQNLQQRLDLGRDGRGSRRGGSPPAEP